MKTVEPPRIPLNGAPIWPLSVAAYRVLGEAGLIPKNTELLYGFVYQKMSKSPLHSALVSRLLRLIREILPPGFLLRSEQPLTCSDSEPEPDVSVIRGREEDFWDEHPNTAELVIEVCLGSYDYDSSKLRAYALSEVKECWLVLPREKKIEAHRKPRNGEYTQKQTYGPVGRIRSSALPRIDLQLDRILRR